MLALWLGAGVIAAQAAPPAVDDSGNFGGDDAPRAPRPVIYLWPERKEEAIEAIEAVEDAAEDASAPAQAISEAPLSALREAIEQDAASTIIRTRLAAAEAVLSLLDTAILDAHRAALIEDMRKAAIAAAMAREQFEIEIALALCLLV